MMGWSCSWIAVRGKETAAILQALALRRPGFFERRDGSWMCADQPDGWFVVFAPRNSAPAEFQDRVFGELSQEGELVFSTVDERAMYSSSAYWKGGERIWSVVYDELEAPDHLATSGRLPSSYQAQREDLEEEESGLLFDVPLALGAELTDFRHDDAGGLKPLVRR
jgi:hypothetical protein